jgi:hypothetical protein
MVFYISLLTMKSSITFGSVYATPELTAQKLHIVQEEKITLFYSDWPKKRITRTQLTPKLQLGYSPHFFAEYNRSLPYFLPKSNIDPPSPYSDPGMDVGAAPWASIAPESPEELFRGFPLRPLMKSLNHSLFCEPPLFMWHAFVNDFIFHHTLKLKKYK